MINRTGSVADALSTLERVTHGEVHAVPPVPRRAGARRAEQLVRRRTVGVAGG